LKIRKKNKQTNQTSFSFSSAQTNRLWLLWNGCSWWWWKYAIIRTITCHMTN